MYLNVKSGAFLTAQFYGYKARITDFTMIDKGWQKEQVEWIHIQGGGSERVHHSSVGYPQATVQLKEGFAE